jgi:hypothetical protein
MAEFSLQELLNLSVDDAASSWRLSVLYKKMKLEGYLQGRDKVAANEVLFDGQETRTSTNFPIVRLQLCKKPLLPSYDEFNISSSGLGDIGISYSGLVTNGDEHKITYSIGISLPTGSIDQQGDTPRGPGNQQLPYTMQLGSGTWDLPVSSSYQYFGHNSWLIGMDLFPKLRVGKNNRSYRLGNRLSLVLWSKWQLSNQIQPFAKLTYQDWGTINGQDDELLVSASFVYPAGITNPSNYGGKNLVLL